VAISNSERLKFTKIQFLDALCRVCQYPENPKIACRILRDGQGPCQKCNGVAKVVCEKTSLENESIFKGY
jgi:hypothetical protein